MKKFLKIIPYQFVLPLFIVAGVLVGLVAYSIYVSRAYSYLSDKPEACINCHIMSPYYASWRHSSHGNVATCNDCHVPHDNVFHKYAFKAKDGLYHAAVFTLREEPDAIRPRAESHEVIMNNCIRCHEQLNTALVSTGTIDYQDVMHGQGKACWDCHQEVPHSKISNIAGAPNVIAPMPESPVPDWLKKQMKTNNK